MKMRRMFRRPAYIVLLCLLAFSRPVMGAEGDSSSWREAGREIKEAARAVGEASKESWRLAREKGREAWRETKETTAEAVKTTKRKIHEATAPKTAPESPPGVSPQDQPGTSMQEPGQAPDTAVEAPAPSIREPASQEAGPPVLESPASPPETVPQGTTQTKDAGRQVI